jgi:hypothetical protein
MTKFAKRAANPRVPVRPARGRPPMVRGVVGFGGPKQYLTGPTGYPTGCLLPPASCLLPPASCLLPPASCLLPPASCLLPPASCHTPGLSSSLGLSSAADFFCLMIIDNCTKSLSFEMSAFLCFYIYFHF